MKAPKRYHCCLPLRIPLTTLLCNLLLAAITTTALAQINSSANIDDSVKEIFSTNAVQRRSGFGTIVTPEPFDASMQQQQFQSVSGRAQCNCVPYHKCDSNTNTIINSNDADDADGGSTDGFGLIDIRFNADDPVCPHFLDVCCADNSTRTESITPRPNVARPNRAAGCGVRNVGGIDFNITGATDNESGFGEFPWTTALLHAANNSYFCAGSLIHPQVVLTAAHCVIGRSFVVRAGEWDSQTSKERLPYAERGVRRIITHPQYNARNVAYDFALVILSAPVTLADHINVICLPSPNAAPAARTICYSTGWGKDAFGERGRWSAIMKRIPLPIVEHTDCQQRLRRTRLGARFALDASFVCAGGERNVDTCEGDGGAPLACPIGDIASQQRYQQSGIVAWGIGCNAEIPAAYANVALARTWIDMQMLANGYNTDTYSAN